ncbi:MAG: lytic transglycosylase domain-containing protein [Candidatus Aegiribacteria sp.]|nr:lytic transglycosylase domain-containing protein [Candidatus Aegiribacteria sp.]
MKYLMFILMILLPLSCQHVYEEELPPPQTEEEIRPVVFKEVDSLYLAGGFVQVRDSLLSILRTDSSLLDETLFRMLGLYHGRAMECDYIDLLESLESEGYGNLYGWKVSALDLAGLPAEALIYLPPDDPLLEAWLICEIDSLHEDCILPIPGGQGEIFSMAMTAAPGSMSPFEIQMAASVADLFPSVKSVVLRELEVSSDTAGAWWDEVLYTVNNETVTAEPLLLSRLAFEGCESFEYWSDIQRTGGEACVIATNEILERFAGNYVPSWQIVDCLIAQGEAELALAYAENGDFFYRAGAEMALLLDEHRYDDLIGLCDSFSEGVPDSLKARAALFRAHALKAVGRGGSVCFPEYLIFASEYPWHPEAREAAYNAGKYFDCEQEWADAAEAYLISLKTSGSWDGDERAHWRGGFSLYMSGRTAQADSLWEAGCARWTSGYWRDEMLFWRARLAGESGLTHLQDSLLYLVAQQHLWEFYGMLAARRLGITASEEFPAPEIRLLEDTACSLAVELTSEGYGVAAVEMLEGGSAGSPERRAIALSLMGRHGSALNMLRVLDVGFRESAHSILPDSLLCFYFPSPYKDLAQMSTDTLVLEASMLQGIMREESYFNRLVISRAGARGVIQLMPGTAYDVSRWYGLPRLEEDEFFDPVISVPYGALYIDRQRSRFNNDIPLFLAAYNAGPENSARWVNMHGWNPGDPELYIEQITYRETRMYVKKVLRSAWIYERLEK